MNTPVTRCPAMAPPRTSRAAWLKHPLSTVVAILVGVAVGVYAPQAAKILAPLGDLYLFFIQMSVYPILVSAIVSGLARLIQTHHAGGSLVRMAVVFLVCMLVTGVVGLLTGIVGEPGVGLDAQAKQVFGSLIHQSERTTLEMSLSDPSSDPVARQVDLWQFLRMLVPPNIFQALSSGVALQIVFFAIIFGVAAGSMPADSANVLINLMLAILTAFQRLIAWSLYGLPFALVSLLAAQIANVGVELFAAMLKFTLLFWGTGGVLCVIATLIIWLRSGLRQPLPVLRSLLEPIMISIATRSSFAALPAAISTMQEALHFERESVSLMLPLGLTISRYGNIVYFALASLFVVQLYDQPLSASGWAIVLLGSIFAGVATAGSSGILTLSMISIVLTPLGLPVEAALIILIAVDTVIDPMRTLLIVYLNMAATALIVSPTAVTTLADPAEPAPATPPPGRRPLLRLLTSAQVRS